MKQIIFFFAFVVASVTYAQNSPTVDKIFNKNTQYFSLNRDAIHVQVNKSTYISGEEIWCKAYIQNRATHKPAAIVSNLYITLIDATGKQLAKKLLYAENGIASGSLLVDKEMASGTYYIQAYTAYGNNFTEDESFTTSIQIINVEKPTTDDIQNENYDIQLLPEGGHLVNEVMSVVGCKIIDAKGKGVYITEAVVKNELGEIITNFKTNTSGLGKFIITPKKGNTYKAFITINGEEQEVDFPKTENTGVVLSASKHVTKDFLLVYLKTNEETYSSIENQKYHIVIHQDKNAKALETSFVENKMQTDFIIPFADLYLGTNTITVFDDNANPIAERLVYNHKTTSRIEPTIKNANIVNDSVRISLNTSLNGIGSNSNLSISILPENTISNSGHENIFTSLLVKPYIKGQIEDPDQYFNKVTRKSIYNLDLLLLTQGWSKYNWNAIFNKEVKEIFEREQGISLRIKLNKQDIRPGTTLSVTSMENGIFESYEIKDDKEMEIKNFALLDSSKVQFSLYRKGKSSKAPVAVLFTPSSTHKSPSFKQFDLSNQKITVAPKSDAALTSFITGRVELDEVLIKTVKNKKDDFNDLRGLTLGANGRIIDEETALQFRMITDMIRTFGFQVGRDQNARITIKKSNRGQDSFVLETITDPIIFLNGHRLQNENLDILDGMRTSRVSRIYHKERDNSFGREGNAGVIHIYTKKNFGENTDVTFNEYKVPMGFEAEKQFYLPRYSSYTSEVFQKYGVIGWYPNINTNEQGNASFEVLNTGVKKLNLYIQGMDANGNLLSKVETIELN